MNTNTYDGPRVLLIEPTAEQIAEQIAEALEPGEDVVVFVDENTRDLYRIQWDEDADVTGFIDEDDDGNPRFVVRGYDCGGYRKQRPGHMDGRARAVWFGGSMYWFQPYTGEDVEATLEALKRYDQGIAGFVYVSRYRQERCNHDCWHDTDNGDALAGVWFDPYGPLADEDRAYLADIIGDLQA